MRPSRRAFDAQHTDHLTLYSLPVQARDEAGSDLYARSYDDELFARTTGTHGNIGRKGGPRQVGSLPHKPPKGSPSRREDSDLFARELDVEELLARGYGIMPSSEDALERRGYVYSRTERGLKPPNHPKYDSKRLHPGWMSKQEKAMYMRRDLDELE